MSIHIATIDGISLLPTEGLRATARAGIVQQMADHLVAGATDTLDLNCEADVIQYLMETPERYRWSTIKPLLDDALAEARQTFAVMQAMQEGRRS